jgi:hypothetical protein
MDTTDHSAQTDRAQSDPARTVPPPGRCNDGIANLIVETLADAADAQMHRHAAALATAAVVSGWLSWEQLASTVDGLAEDGSLDELTADTAEARFGPALGEVDGAGLDQLLQMLDQEAGGARCARCGAVLGQFHGWDGPWSHVQFLPGPVSGWFGVPVDDVGHDPVPVWRYGPAARPAGEVGADPTAEDFDEVDRDRIWMAGAALLGVAGDVVFHHVADGTWAPATDDPAAMAAEARDVVDRLEVAVADARSELDAVTRLTRARAAHRQARQTTRGRGEEP